MKEIPLSQGFSAFVDDEDYDFLMRFKWHAVPSKGNGLFDTPELASEAYTRKYKKLFGDL